MTESEIVRFESVEPVAILTLEASETRNALSPAMMLAIRTALERAVDEGLKAVLLSAAGQVFCAGGDLAQVNDVITGDIDLRVGAMVDDLHSMVRTFRSLPIPTVVAIDGPAIGAGMALALAADVRVAGLGASFVTGYIAVGASPDGGASFHLARALGAPLALSSFLQNRRFTSLDLLAHGLVDCVVDENVDLVALEHARKLAKLSPDALAAIRELVYAASSQSLEDHLDAEKAAFLRIAHTEPFQAGVARFSRPR